jgi:hypothetical protein
MATFISGYLAAVTINSVVYTPILASGTISRTKNVMTKAVAGSQFPTTLAGTLSGTISVSGHLTEELIVGLNTAYLVNAPFAYVFQIGTPGVPTGGGEYGGNCLIESMTFAFDADDEWTVSLDLVLSGAQTYTAEA